MANETMKKIFSGIKYYNKAKDALKGADDCLIMTEWDELRSLDKEFEGLKNRLIIDGRHMLSPKKYLEYVGLCW